MMRGAVSAGSPVTVEVAQQILREGGNAIDAAIAGKLAAAITEPVLTGLAGAGLASFIVDGKPGMLDMFTTMPGLGISRPRTVPEMVPIDMDFGPITQRFMVGHGSVAVPSLAIGLARLHKAHGKMPLAQIVRPAARLADIGVPIREQTVQILKLLWPICSRSPMMTQLLGVDGKAPPAGHVFKNPMLAQTLLKFGEQGEMLFRDGDVARAMLDTLGHESLLTKEDLMRYQPIFRKPLRYKYRDATVFLPGPPSIAGMLILQALRELEDIGTMCAPYGPDQVHRLAAAMARTEDTRRGRLREALFMDGFVDGFMAAVAPMEEGEEWLSAPVPTPDDFGHTTHISVVDSDGNCVGITSSLGESCGSAAKGTGVLINNFLGEEDVNPQGITREPGQRLLTMCCPTIIQRDDGQTLVLGSGGSSRIRSAILHAIVYDVDHRLSPEQIVSAPRMHFEDGKLNIEDDGRPKDTVDAVRQLFDDVRTFDSKSMYFGGLNIAGMKQGDFATQFIGAGDPRRGGAFKKAKSSH
jgi:gamma-glutamyltranspeptidase/glutathione hydrolase